jgi:hypothetical protein
MDVEEDKKDKMEVEEPKEEIVMVKKTRVINLKYDGEVNSE